LAGPLGDSDDDCSALDNCCEHEASGDDDLFDNDDDGCVHGNLSSGGDNVGDDEDCSDDDVFLLPTLRPFELHTVKAGETFDDDDDEEDGGGGGQPEPLPLSFPGSSESHLSVSLFIWLEFILRHLSAGIWGGLKETLSFLSFFSIFDGDDDDDG
jgi:hypothetical protein